MRCYSSFLLLRGRTQGQLDRSLRNQRKGASEDIRRLVLRCAQQLRGFAPGIALSVPLAASDKSADPSLYGKTCTGPASRRQLSDCAGTRSPPSIAYSVSIASYRFPQRLTVRQRIDSGGILSAVGLLTSSCVQETTIRSNQ